MDDDAFRKVQAQFATMFAGSGAGLVDDEELDPDDAPPPMPSLAALEASVAASASAAAARTGRAEKMVAAASMAPAAPAVASDTVASLSWQCQSQVPGGTMTLGTLGRNQLAGSVAGGLGLAALPQPAPSSTGSPSLLVCPIDDDGILSGSGVPLVPSNVSSSATVTAIAWSETDGGRRDGLVAAAWGGGTKGAASEYTLQVWCVSVAPNGTAGTPLHAQFVCRYSGSEAIKSLAWSGKRLAVCCPSSIRILAIRDSFKVDAAATRATQLVDASFVDLPPSSNNRWSECQFVHNGIDRGDSVLIGMSRSDVSFFVCSADFWHDAEDSAEANSPDRPQPQQVSISRQEMNRLSGHGLGQAGGCGELRSLHVMPHPQAAGRAKVMAQVVVTSDPVVAIAEPAQISVASTCHTSTSSTSLSSRLISEVPESPSSETIVATSEAGDGPIDLIGKLGSSGAEEATQVGGGDDNEDGPAIPAFLMLGSTEAEEAAATQSFAALLNKDSGGSAGCSDGSAASSSARLVSLLASADESGGSAHEMVQTVEVGSAVALPELGAYIPDLLACDETTGTLMVGSSHDESCRLHSLAVVQQLEEQRSDGDAESQLADGLARMLQLTGASLDVLQRQEQDGSDAEKKERVKGISCFVLSNGRRGLLALTAKGVNTRRQSPEAIKEAAANALMRGGLSGGGSGGSSGLQALALSSAAVAQYSTVFLAFACPDRRAVQLPAIAASVEPGSATVRRQQRSPSPTGSFGLPSSPLSEDGSGNMSVLLTGDGVSTAAVATVAVQGQRAAVAEWSTATVAQWLISPGPNGPGCAAAVAAAAERASFDGPALLELHALWTGAGAAAGADVSSGRDFAMDILREEMGLTRVGERLRVFHRLRAAAGE